MGKTGLPPQELLKYMLKGFADLLGNLIEEVNVFTRKGLSDRQKELDNLQSKLDLNELEAGGWRGITGRGIDASKIRDLMGEIYGSNNSVAFAKIAGILKYTLKSFTYTFGRALDLAGMDLGVAGEIAEGFKLGLDSFLDLVIHQSFGGAESAVKFIVAKAVESLQDDLFDGETFGYTKLTAPMPPTPRSPVISKVPSRAPGERLVARRDGLSCCSFIGIPHAGGPPAARDSPGECQSRPLARPTERHLPGPSAHSRRSRWATFHGPGGNRRSSLFLGASNIRYETPRRPETN